jgi:hypothetical protein
MQFSVYTAQTQRGSDQLGTCDGCGGEFDRGFIGYVACTGGAGERIDADPRRAFGHRGCVYAWAARRINRVASDWLAKVREESASQENGVSVG